MTKRAGLVVTIVAVIALLVVGGAVALRSGAPDPAPPSPSDLPRTAALAPPTTVPRPAPRLTVSEAIKELELIRPSRQKAAQDFTLPMPGGGTFRLSEHRGKVVFINFWATWCPPCREEMPSMQRLWREHKDAGFVMIAISVDADPKVVPPFIKEHGLTFPVAVDPKMEVANQYSVRALPSSFIVDREGSLAALALGPRVWDNEAAHALVAGLTRR